ncbi:uncharacterized protein LOC110105356 isoform X2 [Dendrobium catenatum]|uniref:uncharacterized protein LOC110105356 isoform X2 n=1 Tax=Dendrobium catenatum TaxID=906689 RepID=UPI0009F69566|nr:uncharacterized protein LOC110105356 isoform X2 [Dendrobium catenatum]
MACRGSISRSIISIARSSPSSLRSPAALPRFRPPRIQRTRLFATSRLPCELGCASSLLPLHSVIAIPRLTSHLSVSARACCELSQGFGGISHKQPHD